MSIEVCKECGTSEWDEVPQGWVCVGCGYLIRYDKPMSGRGLA